MRFLIYGYGSVPIDTFLVGWTSIYQLFWGSLGTRVLTHCHMYYILYAIIIYSIYNIPIIISRLPGDPAPPDRWGFSFSSTRARNCFDGRTGSARVFSMAMFGLFVGAELQWSQSSEIWKHGANDTRKLFHSSSPALPFGYVFEQQFVYLKACQKDDRWHMMAQKHITQYVCNAFHIFMWHMISTQLVHFTATTVGTEQHQTPKRTRYYAYVYTFYMFVPLPESVMRARRLQRVAGFK